MDAQEVKGECEPSGIGLLHTMLERQNEMVDESVKSELGRLRSEVEMNVADDGNPQCQLRPAIGVAYP